MPDPGHAGPEGPLACITEHQRQQPTAPAQPDSLANTQHLPTAPQLQMARAGQLEARPRPGARPPRFDSTRSTTLATRQILPKVEPTVMRLNGRD